MSSADASSPVLLDAYDAYARWAPFYDETPNPLTALEERLVTPVLSEFADCDIVDLGCGTGRWLRRLEGIRPRSLVGVDPSPAMLAVAAGKCSFRTRLVESDCMATPLAANSVDIVLVSFVLSYVEDIVQFAEEAARILRPGGALIISDLHPETRGYGWRRTFRAEGSLFEIATFPYTLADISAAMSAAGFGVEQIAEVPFGEQEATIFRQHNMAEEFQRVENLPVIYWARFSRGDL